MTCNYVRNNLKKPTKGLGPHRLSTKLEKSSCHVKLLISSPQQTHAPTGWRSTFLLVTVTNTAWPPDDNTRPSFGGNIFSAVAATPPTPIAFIHRRRGALPIRMSREFSHPQIGGEFSQLTNLHCHGWRTEQDLQMKSDQRATCQKKSSGSHGHGSPKQSSQPSLLQVHPQLWPYQTSF